MLDGNTSNSDNVTLEEERSLNRIYFHFILSFGSSVLKTTIANTWQLLNRSRAHVIMFNERNGQISIGLWLTLRWHNSDIALLLFDRAQCINLRGTVEIIHGNLFHIVFQKPLVRSTSCFLLHPKLFHEQFLMSISQKCWFFNLKIYLLLHFFEKLNQNFQNIFKFFIDLSCDLAFKPKLRSF